MQMRIAVVSDIHGNRTAFEAVLADLQQTAPDTVIHGGDLADGGSGSIEIVDRIRSLGWQGVAGNTDQMLALPETFENFASRSPKLASLWDVLREMAAATRELLGEERLAWLRALPLIHVHDPVAIVHATPGGPWSAPSSQASDEELVSRYSSLNQPITIYGHILSLCLPVACCPPRLLRLGLRPDEEVPLSSCFPRSQNRDRGAPERGTKSSGQRPSRHSSPEGCTLRDKAHSLMCSITMPNPR
jgi:hypothetical protein